MTTAPNNHRVIGGLRRRTAPGLWPVLMIIERVSRKRKNGVAHVYLMTIRGSTDVWPVKKGFNTFVLFTPNVTDLTVAFFGVPPLDDGWLVLRCGFGVPD